MWGVLVVVFCLSLFPSPLIPFLLLSRDTGDILLKICNLMPQDTGIYTCVAVNDHGSASSSASIKVQGSCEIGAVPESIFSPNGGGGSPTVCLCCLPPAGIPAAPGRPVAQEASSSAVMVHWPPPASSAHCAVSSYAVEYRQEGVCVWKQMHYLVLKVRWDQRCYSPLALRLVALAAGGQQPRGVRSDRHADPRRSLPVQGASLQPLGARPPVRALKYGHAAQHE